jgi:RNA polymerase sigma-70 factor (ECF subfamily)
MGAIPVSQQKPTGLDAFTAVYEAALPRVYGYLLHRCSNPAEAEDLTQETFLAVVNEMKKGGAVADPIAWAVGIARHKWLDQVRKKVRDERRLALLVEAGGHEGEPAGWDAAISREGTVQALQAMPSGQRAVLVLRYFDGYSVPETARLIGRSVHATESLLVRARVSFRRGVSRGGQ